MSLSNWILEKNNPAQTWIAQENPTNQSVEPELAYIKYYESVEIVNRGVNLLVDDASEVNFSIKPMEGSRPLSFNSSPTKLKTIQTLLNVKPNPYQDLNSFRRNIIMDLVLDGNAFIYFDGSHMYTLPASRVDIIPSKNNYIEKFVYDGRIDYDTTEVIHIKDNSSKTPFRGISRLRSSLRAMKLMQKMRQFQDNFFDNGAVPGLVIKTPDVLSSRIKERMKQEWQQSYRPQSGGRKPMILDGGMEVDAISKVSFQELDFADSLDVNEKLILKALGIPPVLIDSGNNANIRPNHRLYYLETIIPIIKKIASAYQAFFGFQITDNLAGIPALQPELRDEAAYYSTLVNGGIMTPNEARAGMGMEPVPDGDEIRVPANVAGSAVNPGTGGRPDNGGGNDDK